jgi:hypothetical protein
VLLPDGFGKLRRPVHRFGVAYDCGFAALVGALRAGMFRETDSMRRISFLKIILAAGLAAAAFSPALATRSKAKMTGACAQPNRRCVSDCDAVNWCTVYTCVNAKSTPVPFWRCFQPSGLCLAPHC